ncbi:MAG: hypothetical protein K6F68_01320 [Clostridiales bacterium]|nr:hypothetical protein [Clostridiales bacterium]
MKLWGKTKVDTRIVKSETVVVHAKSAYEVEDWSEPFAELCHRMNLSRPVILKKHVRELTEFSHTVFLPADFMESVDFDRFEVEVF